MFAAAYTAFKRREHALLRSAGRRGDPGLQRQRQQQQQKPAVEQDRRVDKPALIMRPTTSILCIARLASLTSALRPAKISPRLAVAACRRGAAPAFAALALLVGRAPDAFASRDDVVELVDAAYRTEWTET